ncbi:hypothetical protein KA005_58255, partial [bacterium]|nr:hypothetical protein [bacterium]
PFSSGETVLKFLERYIYSNPEQWYQWKNYNEIKMLPSPEAKVAGKTSLPLFKPALGRVS